MKLFAKRRVVYESDAQAIIDRLTRERDDARKRLQDFALQALVDESQAEAAQVAPLTDDQIDKAGQEWAFAIMDGKGTKFANKALRAALSSQANPAPLADDSRDAARWQPIETAPKNHLPVLTYSKLDGIRAAFRDITWRWLFVMPTTAARPTHWMPLPKAPDAALAASTDGLAKGEAS